MAINDKAAQNVISELFLESIDLLGQKNSMSIDLESDFCTDYIKSFPLENAIILKGLRSLVESSDRIGDHLVITKTLIDSILNKTVVKSNATGSHSSYLMKETLDELEKLLRAPDKKSFLIHNAPNEFSPSDPIFKDHPQRIHVNTIGRYLMAKNIIQGSSIINARQYIYPHIKNNIVELHELLSDPENMHKWTLSRKKSFIKKAIGEYAEENAIL